MLKLALKCVQPAIQAHSQMRALERANSVVAESLFPTLAQPNARFAQRTLTLGLEHRAACDVKLDLTHQQTLAVVNYVDQAREDARAYVAKRVFLSTGKRGSVDLARLQRSRN